jgi:hypothetical protein
MNGNIIAAKNVNVAPTGITKKANNILVVWIAKKANAVAVAQLNTITINANTAAIVLIELFISLSF